MPRRVRRARSRSLCALCERWIVPGQLIAQRPVDWVHAACLLPVAASGRPQ